MKPPFNGTSKEYVAAVLASGRGSNFRAIMDHVRLNILEKVRIPLLICNYENAPVLKAAEEYGVRWAFIDHRGKQREEFDKEVSTLLEEYNVDIVILAGFNRLLSPWFVNEYRWRVINIHPSLTLKFAGLHAQRRALEYFKSINKTYGYDDKGRRIIGYSGCTVHLVDEGVDTGPIIIQSEKVPVKEDDDEQSLSYRILIYEHRLFSKAIQLYVDGRIIGVEDVKLSFNGYEEARRRVKLDLSGGWEERWNRREQAYIKYQQSMDYSVKNLGGKPLNEVL
ncbi:MAG: phosphoribosylglycinamide formyltransferase [Candidatus Nezhaarchaeales archaeon]